jgi:hypothetical protein
MYHHQDLLQLTKHVSNLRNPSYSGPVAKPDSMIFQAKLGLAWLL